MLVAHLLTANSLDVAAAAAAASSRAGDAGGASAALVEEAPEVVWPAAAMAASGSATARPPSHSIPVDRIAALHGDSERCTSVSARLPYWAHLAHSGVVVDTLLGNVLWVDTDFVVLVSPHGLQSDSLHGVGLRSALECIFIAASCFATHRSSVQHAVHGGQALRTAEVEVRMRAVRCCQCKWAVKPTPRSTGCLWP